MNTGTRMLRTASTSRSRSSGLRLQLSAAGEPRLVDERQALQVGEPGELIVELLALEWLHLPPVAPVVGLAFQSVLDVGALGVAVATAHRRKDHVARRHEHGGHGVELRR